MEMIVRPSYSDTGADAAELATWSQRGWMALMSPRARLLRFVISGALSAMAQFTVLFLLLDAGWNRFPANLAGMAVGAQCSFALGCVLTWRDREDTVSLPRRWALFHCSIAGTSLLNLAVFSGCQFVLPTVLASALGIGLASIGNYTAGDRLVFKSRP